MCSTTVFPPPFTMSEFIDARATAMNIDTTDSTVVSVLREG
jgi:hypothetical protein